MEGVRVVFEKPGTGTELSSAYVRVLILIILWLLYYMVELQIISQLVHKLSNNYPSKIVSQNEYFCPKSLRQIDKTLYYPLNHPLSP